MVWSILMTEREIINRLKKDSSTDEDDRGVHIPDDKSSFFLLFRSNLSFPKE
jgi:hypothetical protein